jgi:hypothetical protein
LLTGGKSVEGWRVLEFGPHSFGIERGTDKILVGTIDLIDGLWPVHILRTGGPSKGDFVEYGDAARFVETAFAEAP